ncbi:MAG: zinc ribbon domain-containing protein [Deltaproteobacteria bacterium]|nr:zinc ribbon domain-containing protein [Deltaproteobacteria bacterium]
MPIYEYQCRKCNEVFEIFHKIDEDCNAACPKCLGPAKKLISATSFILKGSGFYVNDYPSQSRKEASKSEKESSETPKSLKAEDKTAEKKADIK